MATCRAPSSLVSGDYLGVALAHVLKETRDGMDEAIALAQHDPAATRQLLTALTSMTRSETSFQRTRQGLIAAGIPDDHLPPTLAETHPPKTRTGSDATVTY